MARRLLEARRPRWWLMAGPTASGKSALALALAEATGGTIVNADALQVYKDLRILSARPSVEEEARAPHRLYGMVPAGEEFSLGRYRRAVAALPEVVSGGREPLIVVGGTGLYFRGLTEGLVRAPPIPESVRQEVTAIAAAGRLHEALALRDPERAAALHPADLPRLQRALELVIATGRTVAELMADQEPPLLPPGTWSGVVLAPSPEETARRVERRFHAMLQAGALEEARAIAALDLPPNRGVMKAHGLPHLLDHLAGRIPITVAAERAIADTRRYAKRQRTWARGHMADWLWLPIPGEEA